MKRSRDTVEARINSEPNYFLFPLSFCSPWDHMGLGMELVHRKENMVVTAIPGF